MSHDASGRTDTKRERKTIFGIFENECHAVLDRHDKVKENIFIFLIFFYFLHFL